MSASETSSSSSEASKQGVVKLGTKLEVVEKFRVNDKDTGSPEVQVALLTRRLETLSKHFGTNPKDKHSQKGMLKMISRRKRLLQYLRTEDVARYRSTISSLGLRK